MDVLHIFYSSKPWRELSYNLKLQRGKCERCGKRPLRFSNLIGHHKVELNELNYKDSSISLNPDLIEIICQDCHNKEHRRFGHHKQKIYIVYGSPLSGKTTLVRELMRSGDIVLDIDALWQAVTFQDEYIKPNNCRFNIFKLRDELLSQIKMRYGKWNDAYIIGGYPDKYERERLVNDLGAELIYCESTKEECISRANNTNRPNEWIDYIESWWEKYER